MIAGTLLVLPPGEDIRKEASSGSVILRTVERESVLEFRDRKDQKLCALDYTSEDGSHGFHVEKSEWSRDGRFFVWSMGSSGGHQPWHHPTHYFDAKTQRVRTLDDYVSAPGISNGEFRLKGTTVHTHMLNKQRNESSRFDLRLLERAAPRGNELHCRGGHTMKLVGAAE